MIGVTGSAGKTTTKDNIAALLGGGFAVGKTVGNLNKSHRRAAVDSAPPDEAKIGVLEMGMNHAGEIGHLCTMARPDFGVVTNVGYAHVENFANGMRRGRGEARVD